MPPLNEACDRQAALDKWFPLNVVTVYLYGYVLILLIDCSLNVGSPWIGLFMCQSYSSIHVLILLIDSAWLPLDEGARCDSPGKNISVHDIIDTYIYIYIYIYGIIDTHRSRIKALAAIRQATYRARTLEIASLEPGGRQREILRTRRSDERASGVRITIIINLIIIIIMIIIVDVIIIMISWSGLCREPDS